MWVVISIWLLGIFLGYFLVLHQTCWIATQERRVLEEFRLKGEKEEAENEDGKEQLSDVESEISAKTGECSDDDFDLDAIIMMSSDEEDEDVVDSGKKANLANVAEELKKSPPESDGSESDIISS